MAFSTMMNSIKKGLNIISPGVKLLNCANFTIAVLSYCHRDEAVNELDGDSYFIYLLSTGLITFNDFYQLVSCANSNITENAALKAYDTIVSCLNSVNSSLFLFNPSQVFTKFGLGISGLVLNMFRVTHRCVAIKPQSQITPQEGEISLDVEDPGAVIEPVFTTDTNTVASNSHSNRMTPSGLANS